MREHCGCGMVWHVGECDVLGVRKMFNDVGMVIRKNIAVLL